MDTFIGVVIVLWLAITTVMSAVFFASDYRLFNDIKQQCVSLGYVQNTTVRINCSLEERK